jgi:hypothetical protein
LLFTFAFYYSYKNITEPETAIDDFRKRIAEYERSYESLDDVHDKDLGSLVVFVACGDHTN